MKIWGLIFFWDSKFCFGNCCTTKIPYIKNFRVIQYFLYISPHWKMLKCSDFNILHWSQNSYVLAIPRLFNPWHFTDFFLNLQTNLENITLSLFIFQIRELDPNESKWIVTDIGDKSRNIALSSSSLIFFSLQILPHL